MGARPWGLGTLRLPSTTSITTLAGRTVRRPGLFLRVDEDTNQDTPHPLLSTGETIHSSVRIRLACGGLAPDDKEPWLCPALLKGMDGRPLWRLERGWAWSKSEIDALATFVPKELRLLGRVYPTEKLYDVKMEEMRWRWVYVGDERSVQTGTGSGKIEFGKGVRFPDRKVLAEEPLVGYWERYLLCMLAGEPDVWRWAGEIDRTEGVLGETTNLGRNGSVNGSVNGNGVRRNGTVSGSQNGRANGAVNGNANGGKGHKVAHSVG
ncbi:hypothetical protein B0T20DRAFT_154424 [Sordaria brevicollis]|uniref:Uncharacterized protein n=1 Tax=Sordaria brevicollis TaxID=83679 RepID=A0AAE0PJ90_SORBR|nr:hypothetical protein B0T20DRAFT_154424 [Sordaria brevicollis]